MSVSALNGLVSAYRADGLITLDEAANLVLPNDSTFKNAKGIGTFTNNDEFEIVKKVAADIKSGTLSAEPGAEDELNEFIAKGPDSRMSHILKGGSIGSAMRRIGAFLGATVAGTSAWFVGGAAAVLSIEAAAAAGAGAVLLGGSTFLAAGLAFVAVGALFGLAGGHVVGMIQGTFDD